ncbi:hypothetical protein A9Q87_13340 [Flavobacteriales bacterium 34_180_T64]|nr:hypothetical protein A9Q87_13340 [Flavobacteriales bacterium 34_180_T64]
MTATFDIIRDNLTRWYLFYVPDTLKEHSKTIAMLSSITPEHYNTVAYFEEEFKNSIDLEQLDHGKIITKGTILDQNMFTLFEAKETYDASQFKFLIEKYKEFLDTHCYITKWLYDNLPKFIKETPEDVINLFRIQYLAFEKHQNKFYDHFNLSPAKLIEEEIKKRISDPNFKIKVPNLFDAKPENTPQKKQIKKTVLITEEEADLFLLNTVFNVPLE